MNSNEAFTLRDGEWQIRVEGVVLPTTWNSKGAATAGLHVELRKRGIHLLSRDCWCNPKVEKP